MLLKKWMSRLIVQPVIWSLLLTGCLTTGAQSSAVPTVAQLTSRPVLPTMGSTRTQAQPSTRSPAQPSTALPALTNNPTPTFIPLLVNKYPGETIYGVQMEAVTPERGLGLIVEANSGWTRRDYPWRAVEPVEGQRTWSAMVGFEQEWSNAAQNGITLIPILLETPDWAISPDVTCHGKINVEKLGAFASFVHDFVQRYSRPPYNLKYIEMWNEPDVDGFFGCWGNKNDLTYYGGEAYGEMLKAIYPAAKSANPEVQILVGGLLLDCDPTLDLGDKDCNSANFLSGILHAGAGNSFDGVAFHATDYYGGKVGSYGNLNFASSSDTTGPVSIAKATYIRNVLAQYQVGGKYVMATETGIKCDGDQCATPDYRFEESKAYFLIQEGAAALAEGFHANIWYAVYGDRNSGFLTAANQPLPAYYAFKFMRSKLAYYNFVRKLNQFSGVMGYEFQTNEGKKQWVVWSMDGQDHSIALLPNPTAIDQVSASGESVTLPLQPNVTVGVAPLFITY